MQAEAIAKPSVVRSIVNPDSIQRLLALAGLVLLFIFFTVKSPYFFTGQNLLTIGVATFGNGILALGVTFVIISGGIDLSIGTVTSFAAVISAIMITNGHLPVIVGILGGIGTGVLTGLINGVIIAKMKVPPFIATLGMLYVAKGLALIISGGHAVYYPPTTNFNQMAMGSLAGDIVPSVPIPNGVLAMFVAAIIASFILVRTILGRYTFALGSNEEATRLSGVNVDSWKIGIYMLCGAFAGIAGVFLAARANSAQPSQGQGYELYAIAAAVIGGTSLSGGEGTIFGTIIGAFVISTLTNGLQLLSVPGEWQDVVIGVIVVLAVYLDLVLRGVAPRPRLRFARRDQPPQPSVNRS